MSTSSAPTPPTGPEQQFWAWFASNEDDLFAFEADPGARSAQLGAALRQVHPGLTFEFGPVEEVPGHGPRRDFVISADGIRSAFPAVQALHAAAPDLPRWRVLKFRPRRRTIMTVVFGGHAIEPDALRFAVSPDHGKVGITAYVPGLTDATRDSMVPVVFLILDQALGEFDVETKAGFIDILPSGQAPADAVPASGLADAFDALVAALRR
ncbi:hypothetical protein GCM10027449_26810 [Sinomonas notoginsengisoli]|uniref:hypothetical protein n=1 Tax=Sinomonas notoginsengisoli TaxID=1457311 RepID=UPI001F363561|nr:hypothetical protein [Sinomonas notoginsengisoli]